MEKVRISGITKKDSGLVIVSYTGVTLPTGGSDMEATLNTKWQSQEVDYLEKDVGIGGEVSVLIEVKGQYTNITKVDMTSAVKGNVDVSNCPQTINVETKPSIAVDRNNSIICQCLLKIAGDRMGDMVGEEYGSIVCERLTELIAAYKLGLSLLD